MRMSGRICEDILHDPFRQFSGTLILFLDHAHARPGLYINPILSIHFLPQRLE